MKSRRSGPVGTALLRRPRRRLIPIHFIVGAGAILVTLMPWPVSLLPGSGA